MIVDHILTISEEARIILPGDAHESRLMMVCHIDLAI